MKNNFFYFFLILIIYITQSKQDSRNSKIEITYDYITENFNTLSEKYNLINSFTKIYKTGKMDLLDNFLSLLKKHKINFNSEFEAFYQKRHKTLERIYNKLKYKDETSIKRLSPAFEWAETERVVIFHIKHSSRLNSLSCPFVDDEKFVIRKNQQDIHYEAKCIMDNNYLFFNLDLKLYSFVTDIQRKEIQRGETYYVINKKNSAEWDGRLIEAGNKLPENSMKLF